MQSLNKNGVRITQTPGEEKITECCLKVLKEWINTVTRIANFST